MDAKIVLLQIIESALVTDLKTKGFQKAHIHEIQESLKSIYNSIHPKEKVGEDKYKCDFQSQNGTICCREAHVSTIYGSLCVRDMNYKLHLEFTKRIGFRGLTKDHFYNLLGESEENEDFIPLYQCCWFITRIVDGERVYCNKYTSGELCEKHKGMNGGDLVKLIKQ